MGDTLIVGRFLGENALAAVGSTYTLTTFLYSIIIGLCMGSGALVSYYYGEKNLPKQKASIAAAFILIGTISVATEMITLGYVNGIITLLKTPPEIMKMTEDYVQIILSGIIFTFLYNYYAYLLRAFGNSVTPLIFLGAAYATLLAQAVSGVFCAVVSATVVLFSQSYLSERE